MKRQQGSTRSAESRISPLPLSALLSQMLVAFTLEVDNEFERRMSDAGHPGASLPHYPLWDMNRGFGP
jgi:hypothetical protein